jgi:hypothetical protein
MAIPGSIPAVIRRSCPASEGVALASPSKPIERVSPRASRTAQLPRTDRRPDPEASVARTVQPRAGRAVERRDVVASERDRDERPDRVARGLDRQISRRRARYVPEVGFEPRPERAPRGDRDQRTVADLESPD